MNAQITGMVEASQYLTFHLERETFASNIMQIREVMDFTTVTKIPKTPEYMEGVINVRGGVVPVVDLRLKFGMSKTQKTVNTSIIIAEVTMDGEKTLVGALADSVEGVIELGPEQIKPPPKIGTHLNTEFIKGMGKHNNEFIIILDIDKVFSYDELAVIANKEKNIIEL